MIRPIARSPGCGDQLPLRVEEVDLDVSHSGLDPCLPPPVIICIQEHPISNAPQHGGIELRVHPPSLVSGLLVQSGFVRNPVAGAAWSKPMVANQPICSCRAADCIFSLTAFSCVG